jgi:hypothetical protein
LNDDGNSSSDDEVEEEGEDDDENYTDLTSGDEHIPPSPTTKANKSPSRKTKVSKQSP